MKHHRGAHRARKAKAVVKWFGSGGGYVPKTSAFSALGTVNEVVLADAVQTTAGAPTAIPQTDTWRVERIIGDIGLCAGDSAASGGATTTFSMGIFVGNIAQATREVLDPSSTGGTFGSDVDRSWLWLWHGDVHSGANTRDQDDGFGTTVHVDVRVRRLLRAHQTLSFVWVPNPGMNGFAANLVLPSVRPALRTLLSHVV